MSLFKKYFIAVCCLCLPFIANAAQESQIPQSKSIVWGIKVSPFVRKVLIVLEEKKVSYDFRETLPASILNLKGISIPDDFILASPLGKIPAFQDSLTAIADSAVISAYLEKKYPERSLYPRDLALYAQALWLEKYADTNMSEVIHSKIFVERVVKPQVLNLSTDEEIVQSAVINELPLIFNYLEKCLASGNKDWLVGNELTIADIAVANHFVSLKLANVPVDEVKWPLLTKYINRVLEIPSFKKVMP